VVTPPAACCGRLAMGKLLAARVRSGRSRGQHQLRERRQFLPHPTDAPPPPTPFPQRWLHARARCRRCSHGLSSRCPATTSGSPSLTRRSASASTSHARPAQTGRRAGACGSTPRTSGSGGHHRFAPSRTPLQAPRAQRRGARLSLSTAHCTAANARHALIGSASACRRAASATTTTRACAH
jgi:hypothetical protein